MSTMAIEVDKLGKRYQIGVRREKYRTLRDSLASGFSSLRSPARAWRERRNTQTAETVRALQDVSFELKHGRVLGIIGPNGAGKSTLLKILSRITEPSEGRAVLHGRVGSLLEVGTGFHPELTGRENVFLNGAILGMRRAETASKFDEIVAFSGIDKYIDTPVKRYSTGMYLRLAFAVAAHLEPEILLVDEVLAVGDAGFQKKCMGKIGEVVRQGRTVLLVSHNMAAVRQLCDEVLLIDHGQLIHHGEPATAIAKYFERTSDPSTGQAEVSTADWSKRARKTDAHIARLRVLDRFGRPSATVGIGQPFTVSMDVQVTKRVPILIPGIELRTPHGIVLLAMRSDGQNILFGPYEAGTTVRLDIQVPGVPVYPGECILDAWIAAKIAWKLDQIAGAITLNFVSEGVFAVEQNMYEKFERGLFLCDCQWQAEEINAKQAAVSSL